jgi:AcrR family transcriptional regulator
MSVKRATTRGAETRARILEAARELLVESGPESLTLRGVAARAALSLGNLQFHFPNLDALLVGLLQQGMASTDEAIRRRAADRNQDVLTAGIDVLLDQHGDLASTRLFFSLWALALGRPALRRLLRRFYADFAARVADTLPKGPDQDARAWLIVALLEGSSVLRTIEGVKRNPNDQALKKALLAVASGRVAIGDDA